MSHLFITSRWLSAYDYKTTKLPEPHTPTEVALFQREQTLPAYAVDGIILARVFQGSTDSTIFEDFIQHAQSQLSALL
jgi:hypothetical protein